MADVGSVFRSIACKLGISSQCERDDPSAEEFKEALRESKGLKTIEFAGGGFSPIICDCKDDGDVDCGSAPDFFKGPQFEHDGKLLTLEEYATMLCNKK